MADAYVQGGSEGSIEFDDSSAAGSMESRVSVVRALVEDVAHSGESRFTKEIIVDDRIWRVVVEQVPG